MRRGIVFHQYTPGLFHVVPARVHPEQVIQSGKQTAVHLPETIQFRFTVIRYGLSRVRGRDKITIVTGRQGIVPLHDAGSQVRATADRQTGNGVSPVRGCDGQRLCHPAPVEPFPADIFLCRRVNFRCRKGICDPSCI